MTTKESSKSKWFTVFSLLKIKKKGQKMKNIDEKNFNGRRRNQIVSIFVFQFSS